MIALNADIYEDGIMIIWDNIIKYGSARWHNASITIKRMCIFIYTNTYIYYHITSTSIFVVNICNALIMLLRKTVSCERLKYLINFGGITKFTTLISLFWISQFSRGKIYKNWYSFSRTTQFESNMIQLLNFVY